MNKRKVLSLTVIIMMFLIQSLSTFAFLSTLYGWSLVFFLTSVFLGWSYIKINTRRVTFFLHQEHESTKQPVIRRSVNHRHVLNQEDETLKKALDDNEKRMENIQQFLYNQK